MVRIRSLGEAEQHATSHEFRLDAIEKLLSDHAQRFDTLQTPWWKRLIFWIDGWPWHDLNATARRWRPWHR